MKERYLLAMVVLIMTCATLLGALCDSGGDDDDDDDDGNGGLCEDSLRIYYYTCDHMVASMSYSEAGEYCGNGGEFWECFYDCFNFADKNCDSFATCANGCPGDPYESGSTGDDDSWADDDSWMDDDSSTDDDSGGSGTCYCHCECYGCSADTSCSPASSCDPCTTICRETCETNCGGYISGSGDC